MNTYPTLSEQEQYDLPRLTRKPLKIPAKFEDSTHDVWLCHSQDKKMVLKVCDETSLGRSSFWQVMNDLFESDFPNSLANIKTCYDYIGSHTLLSVPECIASYPAKYVLTGYIAGLDLDADMVTDNYVVQLARHISQLHQYCYPKWGRFSEPDIDIDSWSLKLSETLTTFAQRHGLHEHPLVQQAIVRSKQVTSSGFVPIMPDLRWDQFRVDKKGQMALIDLDAFVVGPRELELVLLEYILEKPQQTLFKKTYQKVLTYPDLSAVRLSYQVLLFAMNVLGETDLNKWLS